MSITYEEAMEENPLISRARALQECEKHGVSFDELIVELGDRSEYHAREVLGWLGY